MKRLRAALNARAEEVAAYYLGQPKIKQGQIWRYGRHQSSLVLTVQGAKQGLWRDFQLIFHWPVTNLRLIGGIALAPASS